MKYRQRRLRKTDVLGFPVMYAFYGKQGRILQSLIILVAALEWLQWNSYSRIHVCSPLKWKWQCKII